MSAPVEATFWTCACSFQCPLTAVQCLSCERMRPDIDLSSDSESTPSPVSSSPSDHPFASMSASSISVQQAAQQRHQAGHASACTRTQGAIEGVVRHSAEVRTRQIASLSVNSGTAGNEKRKREPSSDNHGVSSDDGDQLSHPASANARMGAASAVLSEEDDEESDQDGSDDEIDNSQSEASEGSCGLDCDCHGDLDAMLECAREASRECCFDSDDILKFLTSCEVHDFPLCTGSLSNLWDSAAYDAVETYTPEMEYSLFTTAAHLMAEEGSTEALERLAHHCPGILTELCGEFPASTLRPAGVQPIFHAACAGQMDAFEFLLESSPDFDINDGDAHGRPPILLARSGDDVDLESVRILIRRFQDTLVLPHPDGGNFESHPLTKAICEAEWSLCMELLHLPHFECMLATPCDAPSDKRVPDRSSGQCFLHCAIEHGAPNNVLQRMVAVLRSQGAEEHVLLGRVAQQSALIVALRLTDHRARLRIVKCLARLATRADFERLTPSKASEAAYGLACSMVSDLGPGRMASAMAVYDAFDDLGVIEQAEAEEQTPFGDNLLHLAASDKQLAKALVVGFRDAWIDELDDQFPGQARLVSTKDANDGVIKWLEALNSRDQTPMEMAAGSGSQSARSLSNVQGLFDQLLQGLLTEDTTEGVSSPASEDDAPDDEADGEDDEDAEEDDASSGPLLAYRDGMDRAWTRIQACEATKSAASAFSASSAAASSSSAASLPYVAAVRGISFNCGHFTNAQRRRMRRQDRTGQAVLSLAAEAAPAAAAAASSSAQAAGVGRGVKIRDVLSRNASSGRLHLTPRHRMSQLVYDSINSCVQQLYTNNYDRMMIVLREIHEAGSAADTKDPLARAFFPWLKPLKSASNPFLSTSQLPGVRNAVCYAFGGNRDAKALQTSIHEFRPKLTADRRGVYFKRPVAGLLSLFLFRPEQLAQGKRANHVRAMHKQREMGLMCPPVFSQAFEITVFGYIPAENHRWQTPVMLPDFRDEQCPAEYRRCFNIDQVAYTKWRNQLAGAMQSSAAGPDEIVKQVIAHVTEHIASVVRRLTHAIAAECGTTIAFIDDAHAVGNTPPPSQLRRTAEPAAAAASSSSSAAPKQRKKPRRK